MVKGVAVKSEHDSALTISTASLSRETPFGVSVSAADQSMVDHFNTVDPQVCGSSGYHSGVLTQQLVNDRLKPRICHQSDTQQLIDRPKPKTSVVNLLLAMFSTPGVA